MAEERRIIRGSPNRSLRAPAGALAAFAVAAPHALGGATPASELAILAVAVVICIWATIALRQTRQPVGYAPVAAVGALLAVAWTGLQMVPIPCGWLATWDPERAELLRTLPELSRGPALQCTLSWSPGATVTSFALAATLAVLLLTSVAIGRTGYRKLLMASIAVSSAVMASVALAHTVTGTDKLFDWYTPKHAKPGLLLAPLLNPNHLAGHLALGFPLCLAYGLRAKRIDGRLVWLGLSFLVLTTGLFTLSRGGVAALAAGGGGAALVHLAQSRRAANKASARGRAATAVLWVMPVSALGAYFTADLVAKEFGLANATTSKFSLMADLLPLWREHPWSGVGRGALGDATPRVVAGGVRVLYAEDLPLHWILEWGTPAAVAILALVIASLVGLRPRRTDEWAVTLGFLALCGQNLVDFSLELAGVASVAAVALGSLLIRNRDDGGPSWLPLPSLRTLSTFGCAIAVIGVGAGVPLFLSNSRMNLRSRLEAALEHGDEHFTDVLHTALKHYPLDPAFHALAATYAVRIDAPNALQWLNLAMRTAPDWAAPHIQAAYWLETRGVLSQAALELRLGLERDMWLTGPAAQGFLQRHPTASFASDLLPEHGDSRQSIAESLLDQLSRPEVARAEAASFLNYVLVEFPDSVYAHARAAYLALVEGDQELALQRAAEMVERWPANPQCTATLMDVLLRIGRPRDALRRFDRSTPVVRAARPVMFSALMASAAVSDRARMDHLSEELFARFGATTEARAELHAQISEQQEIGGNLTEALSHAQRSYDLVNDIGVLERVQHLAERAGMQQVALRAATQLCHFGHHREAYCPAGSPP